MSKRTFYIYIYNIESMGGDGRFHLTSASIFNDQENTDLPPDKVDSDFERHDVHTPVPTNDVHSVNQAFTIRRLPTNKPTDALNLDDSAGSSNSVFDLDIAAIAASTTIVPHTTDHNRIDDNNSPINHVAHSTNISAIQNGSNTQASIAKSSVDDVSSTIDSITDGPTLKKRNLPTKDTSGSPSIGSRIRGLRRPAKKKQKKPPDSPGSNTT